MGLIGVNHFHSPPPHELADSPSGFQPAAVNAVHTDASLARALRQLGIADRDQLGRVPARQQTFEQ